MCLRIKKNNCNDMSTSTFKFILDSRKAFIKLIDELSLEQLNDIPAGFNNNIIWNFGHIVVATQALCYVRTGIWLDSSAIKYVDAYGKGTRPSYFVDQKEVDELKDLALTTILAIQADVNAGKFVNTVPYDTATYGSQLTNIEDILITTVGHDNLHFGYAVAQKKIIK